MVMASKSEQLRKKAQEAKALAAELQKQAREAERKERRDAERRERERMHREAVCILEFSKTMKTKDGQSVYDYIIASYEDARRQKSEDAKQNKAGAAAKQDSPNG